LEHQRSDGAIEIEQELARVEQETENLRTAIKAGFQDIAWANNELARLKTDKDELLERKGRMAVHREPAHIDLGFVEQCRKALRQVLAAGTREERRQFARLFIKKIELEPDTGDILMHLFGRPPSPPSKQTPASEKTGVRIGSVAGACYKAIHDVMGDQLTKIWPLPRNGRRQVQSLPAPVEEDLHEYGLDAGPED